MHNVTDLVQWMVSNDKGKRVLGDRANCKVVCTQHCRPVESFALVHCCNSEPTVTVVPMLAAERGQLRRTMAQAQITRTAALSVDDSAGSPVTSHGWLTSHG